ncbi:MAG: carboxypeptidase regulatory-like domain-containing protein [Acidobacteria bacterium]|nr:carboxypeptidase regulatory-like domain-containing protein [Acidobacteriota bacterium]
MKRAASALLSLLVIPAMLAAQTPSAPTPQTPPKPAAPAPAPQTPVQPPAPAAPKRTTPAQPTSSTVIVTVTDGVGAPLGDVTVTAGGPLDRSGTTDPNGVLQLQGMRVGTYRVRFDREGYLSFEREITTRAGQRTLDVAVTLTPAPAPRIEPPPPPPPPPKPAEPTLPPPGDPKSMALTDWLERNFIGNREPQKESLIGCSGVGQALVWQIREPWTGRQHPSADGMFYVIGGDGTLKLDDKDMTVAAGSFAVVPRGTPYALSRRGRNPLIVLAVLAGAPCAGE